MVETQTSPGVLEWEDSEEGIRPYVKMPEGRRIAVTWAPQPGSQEAFLQCPVFECLYAGTRGPGKTDALLMDFAQHVNQGWGSDWRGVLFRRTYPELQDVIDKSKKWFPKIWPDAKFNEAKNFWRWPKGEILFFRHFMKKADYWSYHGHAYPWIGWEELTTWPSDECYKSMFSCARSTAVGLPIKVRSTTNPYGVGHNWVKSRWRLPILPGKVVGPVIKNSMDIEGNVEPPRVAIHGRLSENQILLRANPDYIIRLRAAAQNKSQLAAWLEGDWNIVAGGMFDDVWWARTHVLPDFPLRLIPRSWKLNRSYDHGQSAPFSVGWWAESNGEDPILWDGRLIGDVRGDLIRIAEWYGWSGRSNEGIRMQSKDIAQGILDREEEWGLSGKVRRGPADSSIFDDYEPGKSVAGDMAKLGVHWDPSDKSPGSRKQGWEQLRLLLSQSFLPKGSSKRETPGLFICGGRCQQFLRTIPVLPRDDDDLDDVDSESEDHIADEARYRVRQQNKTVKQRDM